MQTTPSDETRALELSIELGWLRRERAVAIGALVLLAIGAVLYYVLIASPIVHAGDGGGAVVFELTLTGLFQVTWIAVALAAAAVVQLLRIARLTSRIRDLHERLAAPVAVPAHAMTIITL